MIYKRTTALYAGGLTLPLLTQKGSTMAVVAWLCARENNAYLDVDPAWRVFVLDHLALIRDSATLLNPTPELMARVRGSLPRYMRHIERDEALIWVVRLLNGMPSDALFTESQHLLIPDPEVMQTLAMSYATSSQVRA